MTEKKVQTDECIYDRKHNENSQRKENEDDPVGSYISVYSAVLPLLFWGDIQFLKFVLQYKRTVDLFGAKTGYKHCFSTMESIFTNKVKSIITFYRAN